MTPSAIDSDELLVRYADLVFAGVQQLIHHQDCTDYLDEVPLMQELASWLTQRGWLSRSGKHHVRYPNSSLRADMITNDPNALLQITNEAKYFVLDFVTRAPNHKFPKTTKSSIPHQYLGVEPGKPNNNAVKDIEKLELAEGTHVSFLLVRHESAERSGDSDVIASRYWPISMALPGPSAIGNGLILGFQDSGLSATCSVGRCGMPPQAIRWPEDGAVQRKGCVQDYCAGSPAFRGSIPSQPACQRYLAVTSGGPDGSQRI
jgi:hypothetical protein